MSRSAQRRRIALSKPRVASPFSGSLIFLWPSAPPHLDFGGRVAPAQFYHTAHNDIEQCRYPQRRECFSRSSSAGACSRRPVAWLSLKRSVLISGRSKLCPFSSRAAPEVACSLPTSIVDQLGAGLSSCIRLQHQSA